MIIWECNNELTGDFIRFGSDQGAFFGASQVLDFHFSPAGAASCQAALLIDNFRRLAAAKVFGSPARGMLSEAPLKVGCDAGIKSIVRTEDYIYLPVHSRFSPENPLDKLPAVSCAGCGYGFYQWDECRIQ